MQPSQVVSAQKQLLARGYDVGAVDGDFGANTLAGLIAFAAQRRLDADVKVHAQSLLPQLIRFAIIGPYRLGHFLANASTETKGFRSLVEDTTYRDAARLDALFSRVNGIADATQLVRKGAEAIGNRIYSGRNGNGDEASGDGFRYRGRAYLQHTGRANYAKLEAAIGRPLVAAPQMLEGPEIAALASCAYWNDAGLSLLADRDDAKGIRSMINGSACLGLSDCIKTAGRIKGLFV